MHACNVVMASSDTIEFHELIPVGELIEIVAVNEDGRLVSRAQTTSIANIN